MMYSQATRDELNQDTSTRSISLPAHHGMMGVPRNIFDRAVTSSELPTWGMDRT
jgi:hypothetical protein